MDSMDSNYTQLEKDYNPYFGKMVVRKFSLWQH
jgi:hypothetical protein